MIRLFRVFIPISTFTLLVAEILLMISCYLTASYLVLDVDPADYLLYDGGMLSILVVTGIFLLGLYFIGLYSDVSFKSKIILLYQLFLVTGLAFLFEGLVSSVDSELRMPIRIMLVGSCLSVAAIFTLRLLFSRYATRILGQARVLLVGSDPILAALNQYIDAHPQSGFQIAGYVSDGGGAQAWLPAARNFGDTSSLPQIVQEIQPSRVVVASSQTGAAGREFAGMLENLRYAGQNVQEASETYEKVSGRVWVRGIQPTELIYTSRFGAPPRNLVFQRIFDPLLALAAMIVLFPVLVLTWLFLKLDSRMPVLERNERVGLNNALFTQYRFRLSDPAEGQKALIRRLHLDGLPQLFNILKGDMAFVGPRPARPEFVEVLSARIPYYRQRHCVRPGMTGWAQMQVGQDMEEVFCELEYDLYYIKNMARSLDTLIVFQTLRSMFESRPGHSGDV